MRTLWLERQQVQLQDRRQRVRAVGLRADHAAADGQRPLRRLQAGSELAHPSRLARQSSLRPARRRRLVGHAADAERQQPLGAGPSRNPLVGVGGGHRHTAARAPPGTRAAARRPGGTRRTGGRTRTGDDHVPEKVGAEGQHQVGVLEVELGQTARAVDALHRRPQRRLADRIEAEPARAERRAETVDDHARAAAQRRRDQHRRSVCLAWSSRMRPASWSRPSSQAIGANAAEPRAPVARLWTRSADPGGTRPARPPGRARTACPR